MNVKSLEDIPGFSQAVKKDGAGKYVMYNYYDLCKFFHIPLNVKSFYITRRFAEQRVSLETKYFCREHGDYPLRILRVMSMLKCLIYHSKRIEKEFEASEWRLSKDGKYAMRELLYLMESESEFLGKIKDAVIEEIKENRPQKDEKERFCSGVDNY